jgi:hypothetical protein
MRRLLSIAAFALLLSVPLWAQRGGHGGGGAHAGFGGHGSGFVSHGGGGGHISGGMHSARGFSRGFTHSAHSSPFMHDGFHGPHIHTFGFHNNCFGVPCRRNWYPWGWGYGYYDPWWWDSGSSYDQNYERDRAIANEMNWQSLEEQRMRRQEEADGDQDSYAPRQSVPRNHPAAEDKSDPIMPATVLVFRDQHRREINNYAIVGQTLWNFNSGRTEKIALADLDLPSTEKANDDRGVTFRVPATGEAQ